MLATLGAPQRRMLRGRRGRRVTETEPEPVPTSRATVIRPAPFADRALAASWLDGLRGSADALQAELAEAVSTLNRAIAAHRAARAAPYARDVAHEGALAVRVGFGSGDAVAEGRFADAWELPPDTAKVKRSMESPDERFAALLGGRETTLAAEELVLRARADLDAARGREAALQARIGLEALLAEGNSLPEHRRAALLEDRGPIGDAANAALRGDLDPATLQAVGAAIERLESALRAHRLAPDRPPPGPSAS